jgi:hypothetical protein
MWKTDLYPTVMYSGKKDVMGNKVFRRDIPDGTEQELKTFESAKMMPIAKGFNWGSQEDGEQLALALLLNVCHKPEVSLWYAREFAHEFVRLFNDNWELPSAFIEMWLDDKLYSRSVNESLALSYKN